MNITTLFGVLALRGNAPAYVSVRKSKFIKDEAENFWREIGFCVENDLYHFLQGYAVWKASIVSTLLSRASASGCAFK